MPTEHAAEATEGTEALPLSRFRVLELTVARAGPSAGRAFADWGAEVIRVEPPAAMVSADEVVGARTGADRLNLHRNKKSVALNLKDPDGRAVFLDLVRTADVVIENMRPDVKHRLGVDYEALSAVNPRIVYASVSGFGQDGPYAHRAGVDQIAQGMGGLMSVTGLPGQGPVRAGIALVDLAAGAFVVQAVLMALLQREVTGKGRWVHTSLLESVIALMDFQAARYLVDGLVPGQAGNNHPTGIPSGLFDTADGQIQIAAASDNLYERFCKLVGADDLAGDERYATQPLRLKHRDELNEKIDRIIRTRGSKEWVELFSRGGVPCGPVYTMDETFADAQVRRLGMAIPVQLQDGREVSLVANPANFEGLAREIRRPPPGLGQHTDEVLRELGYDAGRIADLRARNVV